MGGGVTLVNAYTALKDQLKSDNVDVQKGIKVVLDTLLKPMNQIAENAGFNGDEIVEKQMTMDEGQGFNAKSGQWVSMIDDGIIDPTKVTRSALLNAASISALFITTEAGVANNKEEKESVAPAMY
jgi:chaperonin GroEL